VQSLNVPISSVFTSLQSYLGTNYVGDFNFLGRTYQVNLQVTLIAKGAGSKMDQALGTAVFAGMIGVTFYGIFLTPVFFSVIMKIFAQTPRRGSKAQSSVQD
jgi:multidrug efflux pump subunit AcrB